MGECASTTCIVGECKKSSWWKQTFRGRGWKPVRGWTRHEPLPVPEKTVIVLPQRPKRINRTRRQRQRELVSRMKQNEALRA